MTDADADASDAPDPLREQLLDAAARVFTEKGYYGTKIMDIVRAAGLSQGAAYARFASKDDLLMEAVLSRFDQMVANRPIKGRQVADIVLEGATATGPLDDVEAMQLEAYNAARREPAVAAAIDEARRRWRHAIEPLIQRAVADGTASGDADVESILYLMETIHIGLLVQRGAGVDPPDPARWKPFMASLIKNMAKPRRRP